MMFMFVIQQHVFIFDVSGAQTDTWHNSRTTAGEHHQWLWSGALQKSSSPRIRGFGMNRHADMQTQINWSREQNLSFGLHPIKLQINESWNNSMTLQCGYLIYKALLLNLAKIYDGILLHKMLLILVLLPVFVCYFELAELAVFKNLMSTVFGVCRRNCVCRVRSQRAVTWSRPSCLAVMS